MKLTNYLTMKLNYKKGGVKTKLRRESALERLQEQLRTGVKNTKEGKIDLSIKDISRIDREISVLESRL